MNPRTPIRITGRVMRRPVVAAQPSPFLNLEQVGKMLIQVAGMHEKVIELMSRLEEKYAAFEKIKEGPKGEGGDPGKDVNHAEVVRDVLKEIRQPADGKSPEVEALAAALFPLMVNYFKKNMPKAKEGQPGKNADPIDPQILLDTLFEEIKSGKRKLSVAHIDGLDTRFAEVRSAAALNQAPIYGKTTWARGGGDTVKAGTGVTITSNQDGQKVISATGGGGGGGSTVVGIVTPTGTINSSNVTFVAAGHTFLAGSDDGVDSNATLSYDATLNQTTITYSIPPQNNVFALVLQSMTTALVVPTGLVNSSNAVFTVTGRVIFPYEDRLLDVGATVVYNFVTNVSTITYSVPPQNDVSAATSNGVAMNEQIPQGAVNSSNVTFVCTGKITVAYGDSGVDVDAILTYNFDTNQTTITYSIPPQNNVYAF